MEGRLAQLNVVNQMLQNRLDVLEHKVEMLEQNVVMKNDVINQINVSNEGALIKGNRILITDETLINEFIND